jgi:hypothetical protein
MEACERLATRVAQSLSFSCLTTGVQSSLAAPLFLRAAKKYRRFTGENARQLQCKTLQRREKSRRRKNNGKQGKNRAKNNGNRRNTGAR